MPEKILPSLEHIQGIFQEMIDDIEDDLESVTEQVAAPSHSKNRLQKAMAGIKKFVAEFEMKLTVIWAIGTVIGTDWSKVIKELESFISTLG